MEYMKLKEYILHALDTLYARDAFLLEQDVGEWSIAHRLAVYLEQQLPGWNVDCEYNRQGSEQSTKKLTAGGAVRPDIIIHHRGRVKREHNLLAIEIKKGDVKSDKDKACEYTAAPQGNRNFQYQYGLVVSVVPMPQSKWFENGAEIS
jgi:hypothetical protein